MTNQMWDWVSNNPEQAIETATTASIIVNIATSIIGIALIICFFVLCKNIGSINSKMNEIKIELIKLRQLKEKN